MAKKRKVKPEKWQICTEGVTEQNYLEAYLKELGLQSIVDINCKKQRKSGCSKQHESLLDQFQKCDAHNKFIRTLEERWLLHDLDDGKTDPEKCKSFNRTFQRGIVDANVKVIFFNPCFEYWLILHDQDYDVDSSQHDCQVTFQRIYERKRKTLGNPITDRDDYKTDPNLFQLLNGMEGAKKAIERAKKKLVVPPRFENQSYCCSKISPSSNFFQLLEALEALSKQRS